MSAYLIEVDDTKDGVISPPVIGPFPDTGAAEAFATKYRMGNAAESGQGGYSAYHIISDDACDYSPEKYAEDFSWKLEE
jgi:hypothetical protein